MNRIERYEKALQRMRELLNPERPSKERTAASLAKRLHVSKPTVYSRIEALRESGIKVGRTGVVRHGERGPLAVAFEVFP
jgi:DNA-binding Lrp family transcriptional regulator